MANRSITEKYRTVFGTEDGREVLADVLTQLGFYDQELNTPEALLLHNISKKILNRCGIWVEGNRKKIIDSLFSLPFRENKKHKENINGE